MSGSPAFTNFVNQQPPQQVTPPQQPANSGSYSQMFNQPPPPAQTPSQPAMGGK